MDKTAENRASPPVPEKRPARSGYSRLKRRHHWLIGEHERLEAEHLQLQSDYSTLEQAFAELKVLHDDLLADLKRPRPVQYGNLPFGNLMGGHHGG